MSFILLNQAPTILGTQPINAVEWPTLLAVKNQEEEEEEELYDDEDAYEEEDEDEDDDAEDISGGEE